MKKIFKFLIYLFYVTSFFFFPQKGLLQNKNPVKLGFFSITKIQDAHTAGDSSILEFTKILN